MVFVRKIDYSLEFLLNEAVMVILSLGMILSESMLAYRKRLQYNQ